MMINPNSKCFTERCLKTVGLGHIFRLVVMHEISFDSIDFTRHIVKPMAERLGFVCKIIDLSKSTSTKAGSDKINEIDDLLRSCDDERRPLLVIQNAEHLLDHYLATFHNKLRTLLDYYDTTTVIFLSAHKLGIGALFKDSSMPFYCSATIIDLA